MGFFNLFKTKPSVVQVAFRELHRPAPDADDDGGLYLYNWKLPQWPKVGDRVKVPSDAGGGFAIICKLGATPRELRGLGTLKSVTRLVTDEEVAKAVAKVEADLNAWVEMGRRAAGLPTRSRRTTSPGRYPPVPPADGQADAETAKEYARVWSWLANEARDDEERKRFDSIKFRWRAVAKKGGNL